MTEARFAVIGSPISHSRSPKIHRAAYEVLGMDWSYEAFDVSESEFEAFLNRLDSQWRGLSVTMPLKRLAYQHSFEHDEYASQTGVVNTLLRAEAGWSGFNTDVAGAIAVIRAMKLPVQESAVVLGAGATALSVLVALDHLGFTRVTVCARRAEQLAAAESFAKPLSLTFDTVQFQPGHALFTAEHSAGDVLVNTLPGEVSATLGIESIDTESTALFDINYEPWPTQLSQLWQSQGGLNADGLDLLVEQALRQIRIFRFGSAEKVLPHEDEVMRVMRDASVTG